MRANPVRIPAPPAPRVQKKRSRVAEALEACLTVPSNSITNPYPINVCGSLNDIGDQLHTIGNLLRSFLERAEAAGPEPPRRRRKSAA